MPIAHPAQPRRPRSTRSAKHAPPVELQPSFLAPEDATLLADLTRLRLLVAELTARYRPSSVPDGQVVIRSPRDVADLLMAEMQDLPQEQLRVLVLSTKNVVADVVTLYQGTLNASPVRVAEVFRPAIVANAASIVIVHCHPSGDPTPSPEDVATTAQLVKAGQLLDIEVLDHVVIGRGTFVSLKERSLGF